MRDSPVLRGFRWSPLVANAVDRNVKSLFGSPRSNEAWTDIDSHSGKSSRHAPSSLDQHPEGSKPSTIPAHHIIPGVLAVHLRRGDYKRHCTRLANWGAGYMGWNRLADGGQFEDGLQSFLKSDGAGSSNVSVSSVSKQEAYYLAHCLPTIPQVVRRLGEIRQSYAATVRTAPPSAAGSNSESHNLTQVYILTNGWPSFVNDLRTALIADGWARVVVSTDTTDVTTSQVPGAHAFGTRPSKSSGSLGLSREEKGVSAAIDMGLAERAEVFVGNGVSKSTLSKSLSL